MESYSKKEIVNKLENLDMTTYLEILENLYHRDGKTRYIYYEITNNKLYWTTIKYDANYNNNNRFGLKLILLAIYNKSTNKTKMIEKEIIRKSINNTNL